MSKSPKFTKKPNGSWTTVIAFGTDADGRRVMKHLTAKSYNELEHLVKQYQNQTPKSIRDGEMTVGDAVDRYINRRSNELSPSTILNYRGYRSEAFPGLMNMKLSKVTDELVQPYIDDYAATHSPKTVKNVWSLTYAAIKEARRGLVLSVRLPRVRRKRMEMPDKDKLLDCFRAIEGTSIEIPALLAATCGLRRGEIAALNLKKDIDYKKGIIRINKDMVLNSDREWVTKPPKTDAANRAVPCPRWVLEKLQQARDNSRYKILSPDAITRAWRKAAKENDVDCSFHGLRHYYASVMSALGVPDQYAMERMGHTTDSMLKRYQEYIRTKEAEINDSLMNYYDALNPYNSTKDEQ